MEDRTALEIMNSLALNRMPMRTLAMELGGWNNEQGQPVLPPPDCINRLAQGFLVLADHHYAANYTTADNGSLVEEARLSPVQIRQALSDYSEIYCGLTPEGGVFWQQIFRVDWCSYVTTGFTDDMSNFGSGLPSEKGRFAMFVSTCRPVIELALANMIAEMSESGRCVILEERWDQLTPWRVTHWKELPSAHRLICNYRFHPAPFAACEIPPLPKWRLRMDEVLGNI